MIRFMIRCFGIGVLFVGLGGLAISGIDSVSPILIAVGSVMIAIGMKNEYGN